MIFRLIKIFWQDIKTYIKIYGVYPARFKNSKIRSYIFNEKILGQELIIEKNTFISDLVKSIGSYTYIGNNVMLINCSTIGSFCSISHNVKIGLDNHALDYISTSPVVYSKSRGWIDKTSFEFEKSVIIGNDVLISANAMVMSGITIGTGAVIGAGAFVNKDVPPYAIVAGIPARIIRYRFDEKTIERLLSSKWWEKSKKELQAYKDKFNNVPLFLEEIEK